MIPALNGMIRTMPFCRLSQSAQTGLSTRVDQVRKVHFSPFADVKHPNRLGLRLEGFENGQPKELDDLLYHLKTHDWHALQFPEKSLTGKKKWVEDLIRHILANRSDRITLMAGTSLFTCFKSRSPITNPTQVDIKKIGDALLFPETRSKKLVMRINLAKKGVVEELATQMPRVSRDITFDLVLPTETWGK